MSGAQSRHRTQAGKDLGKTRQSTVPAASFPPNRGTACLNGSFCRCNLAKLAHRGRSRGAQTWRRWARGAGREGSGIRAVHQPIRQDNEASRPEQECRTIKGPAVPARPIPGRPRRTSFFGGMRDEARPAPAGGGDATTRATASAIMLLILAGATLALSLMPLAAAPKPVPPSPPPSTPITRRAMRRTPTRETRPRAMNRESSLTRYPRRSSKGSTASSRDSARTTRRPADKHALLACEKYGEAVAPAWLHKILGPRPR